MAFELPSAYPQHKHASEQAREIAQKGLILLSEVGSTVHGTNLATADDTDYMGVCLEPVEYLVGLSRVPATGLHPDNVNFRTKMLVFEQFERHTAWDRGGIHQRSGPGDVDVLVYSAKKFTRLALDGNPTVLVPLFSPSPTVCSTAAHELRMNAWRFASKTSIKRFLGYLGAQKECMTGERSKRTNRPELVKTYGYDTKFAAHAVRLGIQGVEFALNGRISLPMTEWHRRFLQQVRRGEVALSLVLDVIADYTNRLEILLTEADLPEKGDADFANKWLVSTYQAHWSKIATAQFWDKPTHWAELSSDSTTMSKILAEFQDELKGSHD